LTWPENKSIITTFPVIGAPVIDEVFLRSPVDGIAQLPKQAGIYCMMNRHTRQCNIGQSANIYLRCVLHRHQLRKGTAGNMRIRRDVALYGADAFFFFTLATINVTTETRLKHDLNRLELFWVLQFQSHDEHYRYNSEAGGCRTKAAGWRDRERKLMRPNSGKYRLLPGVDLYADINHELLASWTQGD
jgi:hypothetical protein